MPRLLLGVVAAVLSACGSTVSPSPVGTPIAVEQESSPQTQEGSVSTGHVIRPGPPTGSAAAHRPLLPTHLDLWKFHAPIVPVHTDGRELVPPADPTVLGWWGRRAGARHGTTLIVGHSVHTGGGELDDLARTPVGAIARVSGIRYRVTTVQVISKTKLARRAPRLFAQDGPPRLAVVSCAAYRWATGVWPSNAIVIAVPIRTLQHPTPPGGET